MEHMPVIIVGTGGHAKVVAAALPPRQLVGFVDENSKDLKRMFLSLPVYGRVEDVKDGLGCAFIVAIGDNRARANFTQRHPKLRYIACVHPLAWVHESVELGPGSMVMAGAIIQPGAKIGEHVIVNTGAQVDHDCVVEDFVHLAPSSVLCGHCCVGQGAFLGASATLIPQRSIGHWSVVGAGAVVISDVQPNVKVAGVPAKNIS